MSPDQPMTIGRGIRCAAARVGAKPAIVCDGETLDYRRLTQRMARVANLGLGHLGLVPGDRVALIAPNCLPYVELVAGLSDIGVIVATLSPRLTRAELRAILDDCAPRAIFVHPRAIEAIDPAWESDIAVVVLGNDYETLLSRASDRVPLIPVTETDPFALAYTSGTTGRPKGVLLPHRSRAITFMAMAAEYRCFSVDDHFLALAPMCHGAGFVFACAALFFGGTTSLFPANDPIAMLDRIGERDISGVFMVPTQFARLFDLPQAELDQRRDHRLTSIISNAAALPQAMKLRAIDQFGEGLLHETYGSTEGGIVTNIRPPEHRAHPGSVGRPFPGVEIELRNDSGGPCAPGEPGELFSRSPTSFAGYWQLPDETALAIHDGWVTVGDIATRDDDGFITIVDRKKDMVVTGGLNVYPREIENVIAALGGVAEVAVVGTPDAQWGETLHAYVVTRPDASLDADTITAKCRAELAGFKIPRAISFLDELPRNAAGKVLKPTLRSLAGAASASSTR